MRDTQFHKCFEHRIKILEGKSRKVRLRATTAKAQDDTQCWVSMIPTEDLEFVVTADPGKTVFLTSLHPSLEKEAEITIKDGRSRRVTIKGPVLPQTTFYMQWTDDAKATAFLQAGKVATEMGEDATVLQD